MWAKDDVCYGNRNRYNSRKKRLITLNKENINFMSYEMTKIFNYTNKDKTVYRYANSGGKRKEKRHYHQVKNTPFYFPN